MFVVSPVPFPPHCRAQLSREQSEKRREAVVPLGVPSGQGGGTKGGVSGRGSVSTCLQVLACGPRALTHILAGSVASAF